MSEGNSRVSQGASPAEVLQAFQWAPQPEAEAIVRELLTDFVRRLPFAETLQSRLAIEGGVRLIDLIDHFVVQATPELQQRVLDAGFVDNGGYDGPNNDMPAFVQPRGIFPVIIPTDRAYGSEMRLCLRVESIPAFVSVWQTECIFQNLRSSSPLADFRLARVAHSSTVELFIAERHGCRAQDITWRTKSVQAEKMLAHYEQLTMRPRCISDQAAFVEAVASIDKAIADLGVDYTCDLFFRIEREYWQRRNRAAQVQKARQDRLGIGWANHDHHTYRSSRKHFARLISVFEKLGFHCRERFYAGKQAGWGAQVLEQPNAGIVIFADVDLSPDELLIDFAHEPLPERQQLGTVGLWCALHGESFLEAGMHHLECQFDFEALRKQLESEAGIKTMKPFTDFPYLRQAFTEGEWWPVREERIAKLLEKGQITPEQAETFRTKGAVGSHLENLERNQGFKGFNQTGVSEIIAATDPRKLSAGT